MEKQKDELTFLLKEGKFVATRDTIEVFDASEYLIQYQQNLGNVEMLKERLELTEAMVARMEPLIKDAERIRAEEVAKAKEERDKVVE